MWRWSALVGIVLLGILGVVGQEGTASAKEIRFIATEIATDRAIWQPGTVIIDQKSDLQEPMHFILENPTATDHEFAVHGLYMIVPERITAGMRSDVFTGPYMANVIMPIRVLVKAKGTVKIDVSNEGLTGPRELGARYQFFCPLHKDLHLGGVILVE